MLIRRSHNGLMFLVRPNKKEEAHLDEIGTRTQDKALFWKPNILGKKFKLTSDEVYVIGKGPSLDMLTKEHFKENYPVICINESIKVIERLGLSNQIIVAVQNNDLKDTCKPKSGFAFVSKKNQNWYADVENLRIMPHRHKTFTAVSVIEYIVHKFNIKKIILVAFDAITSNNLRYSMTIKYPPNIKGRPERFLALESALKKFKSKLKWITEADLVNITFYSTERKQRSLLEPCELEDEEQRDDGLGHLSLP